MYRNALTRLDPNTLYWLILAVFALSMAAQARVRAVFAKYEKQLSKGGMTAAQVADEMLRSNGIMDVSIERIQGTLTDHYSPQEGVLRLSESVYDGTTISALGVAAHEVGHALQHYDEYAPLKIRSLLVPVAQFGSFAAVPLFILGLMMSLPFLQTIGIAVFTVVFLFYLVTLPVEANASARALTALEAGGYVTREEARDAGKVLSAAGMTYLLAAISSLLQLLRLIALSGGNRRKR